VLLPADAARIGNWQWRLEHLYQIRTQLAQKTVFKMNSVQQEIARYLPHWHKFLILKARQMGVSTLFLLWHLDATLFTPNTSTAIIAHRRDSLKYLFRIIRLAYRTCPDAIQLADGRIWRKPVASFDTANELYFKDLDSTIYVALEVRSDTVHRCHVSEAHHIKDAENVLAATMGALVPGGVLTMETTANGMGGVFYDLWNEAEAGESDFMPLFYGYQFHEDYRMPVPKDFTLTPEEEKYMAVPGMHLEALSWRRMKMREPGMRELFKQEFPANAQEAFLTSGRSPFDREKVEDWVIRAPIESQMEGRLLYWIKPIKDRRYIVAVDCASGAGEERQDGGKDNGTDYSAIMVIDCETLQLAARFRGKWPYPKLHHIVYKLGREYNDGYIAIESEGHGLTVINNLVENLHIEDEPYPQWMIHTTTVVDKKSKQPMQKWGWITSGKTKPLIIDHLSGLVDEEDLKIYDKIVQSEFMRFIINEKGQYEAMEGFHDDTVLACAIGYYLIPDALRAGRRAFSRDELPV
jgi:hypothetical protein